MLVDNDVYVNKYVADGSTASFSIAFPFLEASHIEIYTRGENGGDVLVDPSAYTITGAGIEEGGELIFNNTPSSGTVIAIVRNVPITQLYAYTELDNFPAESHENALAKLTMIDQQQAEILGRALTVPRTSDKTPAEFSDEILNTVTEAARYAQIAGESADAAAGSANVASGYASSASGYVDSAAAILGNVNSAGTEYLNQISSGGSAALGDLNSALSVALNQVSSGGSAQLTSITSSGSYYLSQISSGGSSTLSSIDAAKTSALNTISSGGSAQVSAVTSEGNTQIARLDAYTSSIIVAEATATFRTATMQVSSAIPSETIIALPNDSSGNTLSYYVGKDTLGVSWNGTDCYKNFQYEEVGNANTVSYRIKLLFPASVGDVFCFRCLNAKIDGTIADPLQPDGVTININSSGKLETALTPQAITNAIGYTAADDSTVVKLSGNQTVSGTKTFSSELVCSSNYALRHTDANKELIITGGNTTSGGDQGAKLVLRGGQHSTLAGTFLIQARKPDNTANPSLLGAPDGTLTWNAKNVLCVEESGTGYIRFSSGLQICWGNGAITAASTGKEVTFGKAFSTTPDVFLSPRPSSATTTLYNIIPYPRSTTGFTAYLNNSGGHSTGSFAYLAIGSWS